MPVMAFIKNNPSQDPHALHIEADGLRALSKVIKQHNLAICVPDIKAVNSQQLILERIPNQSASKQQWQQLGDQLARFHQIPQKHFGYPLDNYIGLNPQKNGLSDNWGDFFYNQRLMFQCQRIQDTSVSEEIRQQLKKLQQPLINWLNQQAVQPVLLHGDLWSGNVLFSDNKVWLIDPAVYWGDSEADIAMTELFGGFPQVFYQTYQRQQPMSTDYDLKKICYNLYHYLNHYNLFGPGYLAACRSHLNRLTTALT
ncbi:fructosamine kinase family protein [Marinicella pacifica]|uniref:Fructosamine kinase family protein n=2 Tax=Marinicella pacifica TaxID=1171543 RepID=A0A917CEQ4_9GAMM|nr:fructosamine kinase family protein [Marinicella pacifica]